MISNELVQNPTHKITLPTFVIDALMSQPYLKSKGKFFKNKSTDSYVIFEAEWKLVEEQLNFFDEDGEPVSKDIPTYLELDSWDENRSEECADLVFTLVSALGLSVSISKSGYTEYAPEESRSFIPFQIVQNHVNGLTLEQQDFLKELMEGYEKVKSEGIIFLNNTTQIDFESLERQVLNCSSIEDFKELKRSQFIDSFLRNSPIQLKDVIRTQTESLSEDEVSKIQKTITIAGELYRQGSGRFTKKGDGLSPEIGAFLFETEIFGKNSGLRILKALKKIGWDKDGYHLDPEWMKCTSWSKELQGRYVEAVLTSGGLDSLLRQSFYELKQRISFYELTAVKWLQYAQNVSPYISTNQIEKVKIEKHWDALKLWNRKAYPNQTPEQSSLIDYMELTLNLLFENKINNPMSNKGRSVRV